MDNNYAMGPPIVIFPANEKLKSDLVVIGLELQPAKSCCYIEAAHQNGEWHRLQGAIPEGALKDGGEVLRGDGQPLHGMPVCNVPIWTGGYVGG